MSAPSVPVIEQTAGRGAARAAARKRGLRLSGGERRPGWVTYVLLGIVLLASVGANVHAGAQLLFT